MKLFGIGIGADKRKAKVLPTLLGQLMSGQEGVEVIVDATDAGIAQIDAAEQRLTEMNALATASQANADKVLALEAANKKLTDDNATLTAENKKLGEEAADTHTTSGKKADDASGGKEAELTGYKKVEEQARKKAAERAAAKKR